MTQSPFVTTDPAHTEPRFFGEPHEVAPDVLIHPRFVNSYALRVRADADALLVVDPGFADPAASVHTAVRRWTAAPLAAAIYTHGHADHAFGLAPFLGAGAPPPIIAQENCRRRFERYRRLHAWNAAINQRQFGLERPLFPERFDWPTVLVHERLTWKLGALTLECVAAEGETDDHLYVWVPARRYLFTGDLIIWQVPNCGNPQKVQRYPLAWAEALEAMAALGADWLFPGHGLVVHGADAVRTILTDTARYLRVLVDQVCALMNAGAAPEDIVHAVVPDPELAKRAFLQPTYDHPQFIVRNLLRLWGGWWNGNPADLLPATSRAQAEEIARLAGGVAPLVRRARELLDAGATALASHLAEWAIRAAPDDRAAQALRRDLYTRRLAEERSLMAQGIFRAAANEARRALGEEPLARPLPSPGRMGI